MPEPSLDPKPACPECGAPNVGGREGCEALFDEIRYEMLADVRVAAAHRLAFDAYCIQHIERYCVSAKSYAAHLVGLCCGVEFGGKQAIYDAIPRWLNGRVELIKPPVLTQRGALTVVDIRAAETVEEEVRRMRTYAGVVWDAYASQHETARALIQIMMAGKR